MYKKHTNWYVYILFSMLELVHDKNCPCKRDPVKTREKLLESAYSQIHRRGFQAVSLDEILRDTGVTKGALYHHFPNKTALGYAVVEEIIGPSIESFWLKPVLEAEDPITALELVIRKAGDEMSLSDVQLGCPLNNLSQEMSAADEGFRQRLQAIYDLWRNGLATAFKQAQANGLMAPHHDPDSTATFIIATLEGCIGMAKNAQDMDVLMQCGAGVIQYLGSLKHPAQNRRG